ncbi:MAG: hypothetical protein HRU19_05140 [Pseudobacteriovorax sp.]|nr:hypothetical protein [Pseudobacteriovorax sp.]
MISRAFFSLTVLFILATPQLPAAAGVIVGGGNRQAPKDYSLVGQDKIGVPEPEFKRTNIRLSFTDRTKLPGTEVEVEKINDEIRTVDRKIPVIVIPD